MEISNEYKISDAYILGGQAYLRGDDESLCPYDESDAQFDEWHDGYNHELVNDIF